jgi:hypothetical protein
MPKRKLIEECPLCGFEPEWDTYELVCRNCDTLIGTMDTVRTPSAFVQQNREFHAAFRDACTVLMQIITKHADLQPIPNESLEGYQWAREQAEESDMIAAGTEISNPRLKEIIERMKARNYEA